ncbi:recombinase A, partial [Vibrio echinoideorum]
YQQVKVAIDQNPQAHELMSNMQIKSEKADLEKEVLKYARKGKGLTAIQQELRKRQIETSELPSLIDRLINEE